MNTNNYGDIARAIQDTMDGEMSKISDVMAAATQWEAEKEIAPMRTADSLQELKELLSLEIEESKKEAKTNRIIAISALIVGILTLAATIAGLVVTLN